MGIRRTHIDYETRSFVDISNGVRRYAEKAEVILAAWASPGEPIQQWDRLKDTGDLSDLMDRLQDTEMEMHAFNASFEREITGRCIGHFVPYYRWHCTMAYAYSRGFSGKLKDVCKQLEVPEDKAKLAEGGRLINRFCIPRKPTKNNPRMWFSPEDNEEQWDRFCLYNRLDVEAERYIFEYLDCQHPETPEERETWLWDQAVNGRGLPVDMALVDGAIQMAEALKAEAMEQMRQITGLNNPNSRDQLLGWLRGQGYPYGDLQKETIARVLG